MKQQAVEFHRAEANKDPAAINQPRAQATFGVGMTETSLAAGLAATPGARHKGQPSRGIAAQKRGDALDADCDAAALQIPASRSSLYPIDPAE